MTNKLKKLFKLGILIFGIALFFTNCEKENITSIEETNKTLEDESVFIEEISIS